MLAAKDATTNGKSTFVQRLAAASLRVDAASVPSALLAQTVAALLPLDTCRALLMRAEYLAGRGCYGAASDLLASVTRHAAACGDVDTHARSLLKCAQLEALARRPERAVELVQQAQALGGGMQFWKDLICSYATYRYVAL
jgi:hypothetical protein